MVVSKPKGGANLIKEEKFLLIGGDKRQIYIADYLEKQGKSVSLYALPEYSSRCIKNLKQEIGNYDFIILPLPVTKDNKNLFTVVPIKETLDEIISYINEKQIVFAGMSGKGIETKIRNKGAVIYDYFKREDVTVMNTVPTVQGVLKVIFENIEYTVHSSNCAVFGYGRIAKLAASTLASLGADVTVCVRKISDIALAEVNGLKGCRIIDFYKIADKFDIIINTVPSLVIDRKILEKVNKKCLITDVASAPFGTDFAAADELGIKAMQCSSLPGKVAPETAGKIIAEGIINILKEEGYE